MKEYKKYLTEMTSSKEVNILDPSRSTDIQKVLDKAGIESKNAGYGGREYIEFEYRGKRYEISQVDK